MRRKVFFLLSTNPHTHRHTRDVKLWIKLMYCSVVIKLAEEKKKKRREVTLYQSVCCQVEVHISFDAEHTQKKRSCFFAQLCTKKLTGCQTHGTVNQIPFLSNGRAQLPPPSDRVSRCCSCPPLASPFRSDSVAAAAAAGMPSVVPVTMASTVGESFWKESAAGGGRGGGGKWTGKTLQRREGRRRTGPAAAENHSSSSFERNDRQPQTCPVR